MAVEQTNPEPGTDGSDPPSPDNDVVNTLLTEVVALRAYAVHHAVAAFDLAAAQLRRFWQGFLVRTALGIIAFLLAITFAWYLVRGIDGGFIAAVQHEWLGHLMTGGFGLLLLCALIMTNWSLADYRRCTRSIAKFRKRKARERVQVGNDVDEAAHAQP